MAPLETCAAGLPASFLASVLAQALLCSPTTPLAPARSTDMIVGFCGESEGDHAASLDLMRSVAFDQAFMYAYSLREKTHAARNYQARSRSSL